MCWQCDNPQKSRADYLEEVVLPTIRRCGWMVQGVGGTRLYAPFAYTVGLTAAALPELVLTGLSAVRSCTLLNTVGQYYLGVDPPPQHGERVHLTGGPCTEVVDVPHPDAHLFIADDLYGPSLRAQQLVWADGRGTWPWQAGHRASRGGQPVLGPRAARRIHDA